MKSKILYFTRLLFATTFFILLVSGFLGLIEHFSFANFQVAPLTQKLIADFSIIVAVFLFIGLFFTLLFGRIYCSTICPLGFLQEILTLKKQKLENKIINLPYKYFIFAVSAGLLFGGSSIVVRYIGPFTIFSSALSLSIISIISALCVLLLAFFKKSFFCTNICPVGTLLGLFSKISLFKIHFKNPDSCVSCGQCEKICRVGCIDVENKKVDNELCVKCFRCLTVCPKNGLSFDTKSEKVKFNPKRREVFIASGALLLFASVAKTTSLMVKNGTKKIKNIILPPGAKNANRMANTCLNCNYCVNSCPNKILVKADKNFHSVHIDFEKGKGYCEYNCNECSKKCPSGAIKKLTLKEKQNTKIAIALFDSIKCTNCGACIAVCPKGAIMQTETGINIDETKCIGCGKCKKFCSNDAIHIRTIA